MGTKTRPHHTGKSAVEKMNLLKIVCENGCWITSTKITNPMEYDRIWSNGRCYRVHKLSYEIYKGKIPNGCEIDHLCRNRKCFNPDHLEAVTHKVNILRGEGLAAKKARQTHCIHGHELSGDNLYAYLYKGRVGRYCIPCHKRVAHKSYMKKKFLEQKKLLTT
jgi:hypothetical protein